MTDFTERRGLLVLPNGRPEARDELTPSFSEVADADAPWPMRGAVLAALLAPMRSEVVLIAAGGPLRGLDAATALLLSGRAELAVLRGPDRASGPAARAYRRYHGAGVFPRLRRALWPGHAKRACGGAALTEARAERLFRGLIDRADDAHGTYLVAAAAIACPGPPLLLRRDRVLKRLAAKGSLTRGWHESGWTVAVPPLDEPTVREGANE